MKCPRNAGFQGIGWIFIPTPWLQNSSSPSRLQMLKLSIVHQPKLESMCLKLVQSAPCWTARQRASYIGCVKNCCSHTKWTWTVQKHSVLIPADTFHDMAAAAQPFVDIWVAFSMAIMTCFSTNAICASIGELRSHSMSSIFRLWHHLCLQ